MNRKRFGFTYQQVLKLREAMIHEKERLRGISDSCAEETIREEIESERNTVQDIINILNYKK